MNREHLPGSPLAEAVVTLLLVAGISALLLRGQLTDPWSVAGPDRRASVPSQIETVPELPGAAGDSGVSWRDDFDDLGGWVEWAGNAAANGGVLTLTDRDGQGTIILQRRPLKYAAADLQMRVRSPGGVFSLGVAAGAAGPIAELSGSRDTCAPRDGISLDVDFRSGDGSGGRLRWMREGQELLGVLTQAGPLPRGDFALISLSLRPHGCRVAIEGRQAGEIGIPWEEGAYRLYLGTRHAPSEVDYIALSVPQHVAAAGSASPLAAPRRIRLAPELPAPSASLLSRPPAPPRRMEGT